ncbi:MAG: hypothetical protein ACRCX7_10165 [Cetobacterium sp.]|uniref:hypothetical protein n=1 Tax=Cetobacterium sp. TaxID=2071632 RepID=UPI003F2D4F59
MRCDRRKYCKYGNNINGYCKACIKYYEGVRYYPAGAKRLFIEGTPIKLVLFNFNSMEGIKKEYLDEGKTECDFYKDFYEWMTQAEHFKEDVKRVDG